MKVITQREFRNNSAAVMDAVEAGEVYCVTRNGVEVAELRQEADEFFGTEDRLDPDDAWE
ncbi:MULTISPECIES: type II toxin-antitoxin system Phd/YefM family antitoxin [Amycolatopsis]|uniref:Antitoxin n=1 Tax=Amycolatopsis dendrobii TaxID=2760662 RepID=A0A7W3ZCD3_9PSEU|nr:MULTISPECIES: type II toxin-antitoxin system prevent-host-death family antitoxin [Amycolatopsis]MBB1155817.1 type II toxin-antitoxin system Phd/YefM family antitoxin [Amycolatopsis dendrobii]UKD53019.1 type II toxin-antitoxin system Phd/YefM family antitoxin [Amycolatopsis sp. FU40]